jgi:ubiquinone/menaquinone biosynthesis C-methylase UbiE
MRAAHDDHVDAQFGPRAAAYVTSAVHAAGEDLDRIEALAAARSGGVALDLGCGGGHVAYRLAPVMASVVACDLSQAMLDAVAATAAARGLSNISTRQVRAERLPFEAASFDLAASRFSAHHWGDLAAGLSEVRRVLKADGRAVFVDAIAPERAAADTHLQAIELLRDTSHVRDYSAAEWTQGLSRAGLAVESVTRSRIRMEFKSWIERMGTPQGAADAILALQSGASAETRAALSIEPDGSFMLDVLLAAARPA